MITDLNAVKILNAEKRREAARASAEKVKAQQDADAANGWGSFLETHCGSKAVRDGIVFFDCTANRNALELFLDVEELPLNAETLEFAYRECRPQLAKTPVQQYERKVDLNESRILPQRRTYGPEPLALPYTREEILSWSKGRLKQEVSKSPRHLAAVNAILAGQN